MSPDRWEQVERIYHAALEIESSERPAFLDQACAGDENLRREVQSLLNYETRAEGFIEAPALEVAAGLLAEDDPQHIPGRRIGSYEIRSVLGAGGMGTVYLAEDTRLGRKVALKLLPVALTQDLAAVRRFELEARAASALNHPNIITILEIAKSEHTHYIATEFVDGQTLRDRLKKPLELREVLDIAHQVANALIAAHEAGIVHRDIKPENIMVRRDGYVKVLDFGLVKLIEPQLGEDSEAAGVDNISTEAGLVMGTARYMSPEQARGQKVDTRTDVFSFGVVLYEMITGCQPFAGDSTADLVLAILSKEPAPLARFRPDAPETLQWIVTKALRKERDDRYQTVKGLLSDLKNLRTKLQFEEELERSSGTRQMTTAPRPAIDESRERRRRGWRVAALLAVATVAVVAGIWFMLRPASVSRQASSQLKNLTFSQLTDQSGPEYFPTLSPDGKSLVYASRAAGNWDIYFQRVGGRNPINLTKDSLADDTQPAFSSDGERIAFRSEREGGGIYVMGATGESIIRLSDFGYTPAWSSDGEQVFVATERIPQPSTRPSRSQLWAISVKGGSRHLIADGDALQPSCSPHGKRITYWSRPGRIGQREGIWTIPAGGGEPVAVTDGSTTDLNPVWSPDGKHLYFSSSRGGSMNIWRVALDEESGAVLGEPEAVTTIGAATSALHLSLSGDGRRLAYIAQDEFRNLRKIAFDPTSGNVGGEPISITRGTMQLWFPDPSPDGEWLACYSMGNLRHIFLIRPDGTDMRDLTDDAYRHYWPRWSPDGKRIAFSSRRTGNYELWVINRDGSGLRQLTQDHQSPGAHYSPWSPDGSKIAYSIHAPKNDCIIFQPEKAWSDQQFETLSPLSDSTLSFEGWSFSPDGKKLAGIRHLPSGIHSGIGVYDLESKKYDWLTDFGDWPLWLNDNRHLLFVSQGKILLLDSRTGKSRQVFSVTDEDVDIGSPGLSRDNRTIYFTYVAAEADIWLLTLD